VRELVNNELAAGWRGTRGKSPGAAVTTCAALRAERWSTHGEGRRRVFLEASTAEVLRHA
jgi:hypothetical protein